MIHKRRLGILFGLSVGLGIGLVVGTPLTVLATPVDEEILRQVGPRERNSGRNRSDLVELGRRLFFDETFDGNGRTCGTCHPATNNFTIDPAYIRGLPRRDPLFVAEHNPKLKGLENSKLLRSSGLILENIDGFDRPGVLRGVPHNLALPVTTKSNLPQVAHALGWSGDGSPGEGSVRFFTLGAVVQHFPKSLDRQEGIDFRIPTDEELDALEAFMMSLGRQKDIDLAALTFTEEAVQAGKLLFNGEGVANRSCAGCHRNAGANRGDGINANFDTGSRLQRPQGAPPDGGFGRDEMPGIDGFGDGRMNTPSLIEAADTPPFFHNNSASTLEKAIAFYTTRDFADSPAGQLGGVGAFNLSADGINEVGAFLRTLNAMENIRLGNLIARDATLARGTFEFRRKMRETVAETQDAIEVLTKGPLSLYSDPNRNAVGLLREAFGLENQALRSGPGRGKALVQSAIRAKNEANALMIE
jgi:cytochrome c peroxidase